MRVRTFLNTFSLFFFCGGMALADHPNEGKLIIEQLIREAESNSLELKQAQENLNSSEQLLKSKYGKYSPKISIEGGPLSTKFDHEKNNGTAVYGKAEWNLYNGGADSAEVEKSKVEHHLQQKKINAIRFKVRRDVKRIYYDLLFILESLALKERAISINAEQMKMAIAKKNSGFTSNGDVIEFELRESTLKSDLLLLNQEREQKSRELDVLLSRKEDSGPLDVKGHLTREPINLNREQLVRRIKEENIELAESFTDAESARLEKRVVTADFLPKVNFEASYGKLANEEMVFNETDNYSMMLKVSIPLFSGFETKNAHRSLAATAASKKLNLDQKQITIFAELDNTLSQIKALNQRLDIEEKNLSKSEEYYKITLGEYKRGIKNSPDMVGAAERLLDIRIRNLEYRRDLILAHLRIHELMSSDPIVVQTK